MSGLRRLGPALFAPILAVVVAVVISSAVMAALQVNPLRVFEVMFDFGDTPAQQVTALVVIVNRAIPLFLAGLAVAVAFRMGLFNIGVEGQYRLATIMAAAAGAAVSLPAPLHVVLIVVVAMLVGALWAGIVAVLKVTRGVSEVISSIMLNFVALGLASYFLTGPFRGTKAGTQIVSTKEIPETGWVPSLNGILGALGLANPPRQLYGFLVIAIVAGVVVAVLLNRTRFGFDLRATGLSASAAVASGVDARG
ncbi:MAG TPA: ABC transporter permease, partial [Nocardioidaceae bacterium]|nr:ABC transporter permease [Nocardioidaceae bacterium]